ncbi:MAG: SGNH/GDSL hydrolase family protein [Lachnospiraceae bacterium]|nr:SGNH/GDSL hydrolase family protein [Lachnospiraceae bacterium]
MLEQQEHGQTSHRMQWILAALITVLLLIGCCFASRMQPANEQDLMAQTRLMEVQGEPCEAEVAMLDPEAELVILGDSIMAKEREYRTMASYLMEATGLKVYNAAFGGSCAQKTNREDRSSYHEDSLNLYALQEAICSNDYGVQLADLPNNAYQTGYFARTILGLSRLDFTKVRYLIIEHGTNDCIAGLPLSDPGDPYSVLTFEGAMRLSIEHLQQTYPGMQIILVSPTYCKLTDTKEPFTETDFGYGTVEDFYALEQRLAAEYDLPLIDVLHGAGINEENVKELTEDGLHLNAEGRDLYGTYLGAEVAKLITK